MYVTFTQFVSAIGICQGALLALTLLFRPRRKVAHRLFGTFILVFSLGMLESFCDPANGKGYILFLSFIGNASFLYGPLIYLFVRGLVRPDQAAWTDRSFYHLLPFLITFGTEVWDQFLMRIPWLENSLLELFLWECFVFQVLTYIILSIRLLVQYRQNRRSFYANDLDRTRWLQVVLTGLLVIFCCSFFISHTFIFGFGAYFRPFYIFVQIGIALLLYYMSYEIMMKPQSFEFEPLSENVLHDKRGHKYIKSGLSNEKADKYLERLLTVMTEEKPYLDPKLSILKLAQKLEISRNHLTQVINEKLEKNFHRFVNEYRVKEAQELMLAEHMKHFSLSSIGLEAGFNSKAAFNGNFKKIAGHTPSQWLKIQTEQVST